MDTDPIEAIFGQQGLLQGTKLPSKFQIDWIRRWRVMIRNVDPAVNRIRFRAVSLESYNSLTSGSFELKFGGMLAVGLANKPIKFRWKTRTELAVVLENGQQVRSGQTACGGQWLRIRIVLFPKRRLLA